MPPTITVAPFDFALFKMLYPARQFPVLMPMPTISPGSTLLGSNLDRFVDENGITDKIGRRGSRNREKPSRRNDASNPVSTTQD